MTQSKSIVHETLPDPHQDDYSKTLFGLWVYLLTDFMMFASLLATYLVLRNSTFGGPSGKELFSLSFTLGQTLLLLAASFIVGLGNVAAHRRHKGQTLLFFSLTFFLGLIFLGMQLKEMGDWIHLGHTWNKSAYLSIVFTLIGTYAIHVILGLLWIPLFLIPVWLKGINAVTLRRVACLKMFWQFLNFIWIFIFAIVYLLR